MIDPEIDPIALQNPISSDLAVMRTSLIPGLLSAAAHNVNRQQTRVRLFETGLRFLPNESLQQTPMLALLICGLAMPEGWSAKTEPVDFYDLKGEREALLGAAEQPLTFRAMVRPGLHDGQTAEVRLGEQAVRRDGTASPQRSQAARPARPNLCCRIGSHGNCQRSIPDYQEISRFPEVRRDLALIVRSERPRPMCWIVLGPQRVRLWPRADFRRL